MGLFRPRPVIQNITVVVDEVNVDDAVKRIETAARKAETVIAEAKAERGKLEAAVATARRRGQGRW